MTARALTPEERKAWRELKNSGYTVEKCYSPVMQSSIAWRWKRWFGIKALRESGKFQTRQDAIRDAIKKEKKV